MPDWLAHIFFAYILCKIAELKLDTFRRGENVALVIVGSLLPDLVKIALIFDLAKIYVWDFIMPLHTPIGSLLVAALISLAFYNWRTTFLLLTLGFLSHYALDMTLGHVSGGMLLLFPFSWNKYQLGLIHSDDFRITLILGVIALVVYLTDRAKKFKSEDEFES